MSTEQPNVLWIYGEDLSPDLGCYGTPVVSTPNIDRLASEGVRLYQCFRHMSGLFAKPLRADHRDLSDTL